MEIKRDYQKFQDKPKIKCIFKLNNYRDSLI